MNETFEAAWLQAIFDCDGGVYSSAEEFLRLPSDPHEERKS